MTATFPELELAFKTVFCYIYILITFPCYWIVVIFSDFIKACISQINITHSLMYYSWVWRGEAEVQVYHKNITLPSLNNCISFNTYTFELLKLVFQKTRSI